MKKIVKIITDKWKGWKYRKAASAAAVVVLMGCRDSWFYQGSTRAMECARAAIQDVEDYYTEDGVISFGEEYSIISEVNGPVKELLVKENDPVKQGDVLFEVETSDYQYQLTAAENALAGLEAQLEQEQIGQMMTASPQEYLEQIRQEMETAQAKYQSAKTVYDGSVCYMTLEVFPDWRWRTRRRSIRRHFWHGSRQRAGMRRVFGIWRT